VKKNRSQNPEMSLRASVGSVVISENSV